MSERQKMRRKFEDPRLEALACAIEDTGDALLISEFFHYVRRSGEWQDESRIYTAREQARDVRLDCEPGALVQDPAQGERCHECGDEIQYCCTEFDCNCRGLPLDPCSCVGAPAQEPELA